MFINSPPFIPPEQEGQALMRYGRKGCKWLQKEGRKCDHLLNRWELPYLGPILDGFIY